MQSKQVQNTDKQQHNIQWNFNVQSSKIWIQANSQITYKGELESGPIDINHLINFFQTDQYTVLLKTTTKLQVLVAFMTITLQSQSSLEISQLKTKITECQDQIKNLKTTIQQLKGNQVNYKWQDVDLNNAQELFDLNFDYKVTSNDGLTYFPMRVTTNNLFYLHSNNSQYYTAYNTKNKSTAGFTVTKIQRRKN